MISVGGDRLGDGLAAGRAHREGIQDGDLATAVNTSHGRRDFVGRFKEVDATFSGINGADFGWMGYVSSSSLSFRSRQSDTDHHSVDASTSRIRGDITVYGYMMMYDGPSVPPSRI